MRLDGKMAIMTGGGSLIHISDESSFVTGAVIMVDGGSAVVDVGTLAHRTDS